MNVEEYEPKEGAKVKIVFNDGTKDRIFMKTFTGGKVEGLSDSIFKDIRDFEKTENPTDSDDPFAVVNVKIEKEDHLAEKINHFFEKIAQELKFVQGHNQGSSYLSVVQKLKTLKTEF